MTELVPWPSGKARVCKTLIRRFKSGWYLKIARKMRAILILQY